jgi:hypothetical protein
MLIKKRDTAVHIRKWRIENKNEKVEKQKKT